MSDRSVVRKVLRFGSSGRFGVEVPRLLGGPRRGRVLW